MFYGKTLGQKYLKLRDAQASCLRRGGDDRRQGCLHTNMMTDRIVAYLNY